MSNVYVKTTTEGSDIIYFAPIKIAISHVLKSL